MSVQAPVVALAFGGVTPPQGDVVELKLHLGCTNEVSSFEVLLQNFDGKYSPNGAYPLSVAADGSLSVGRGVNCPLLMTCHVESVKYESTPAESYVRLSGRCWGERLFRRVVTKAYANLKGEAIVKDLLDYYVGLSHVRSSTELVEATDTTYTDLAYEDTPAIDILRSIAESADKQGTIGYDFRVAPDGKFEFFAKNSKNYGGAANNGTINGATWVAGHSGTALSFNGTTDRVVTASVPHNIGTGDFTWACWVYPTSFTLHPANPYYAVCSNGTYAPAFYVYMASGKFGVYWSGDKDSGETVSLNTWTFLVVQRQSGVIKFFKNGVQSPNTFSVASSMSNAVFTVGNEHVDGIGQFAGKIDEVQVYNRALSPAEIQAAMNNTAPRNGLVGEWLFNEGTGTTAHNSINWILSENIEQSEYNLDVHRIRNRTTVYGAADKSVPANKAAWTDSLTPTDGNWTAIAGTVSIKFYLGLDSDFSIETYVENLEFGECLFTLSTGTTVNANLYPELCFGIQKETVFDDRYTVLLFDASANRAMCQLNAGSPGDGGVADQWTVQTLKVGSASADSWVVESGFDWTQIWRFGVACYCKGGNGTGSFWVSRLFFGGRRYTSTQEDTSSQTSYGLRELVEVNEELWSDLECEGRAGALLSNLKDPAESLTLKSTVLDYGNTPILAGDTVHVQLPVEGVNADFRVLSVEYRVDGAAQTLETTLELGREAPLLADYVVALKAKTESLSRYKVSKRG